MCAHAVKLRTVRFVLSGYPARAMRRALPGGDRPGPGSGAAGHVDMSVVAFHALKLLVSTGFSFCTYGVRFRIRYIQYRGRFI